MGAHKVKMRFIAQNADLGGDAVAVLTGTLTGTTDDVMEDVADIAISEGDTYTDAAVNTAVNAAILKMNLQLKELQVKQNELIAALQGSGAIK